MFNDKDIDMFIAHLLFYKYISNVEKVSNMDPASPPYHIYSSFQCL